MASPCPRRWDPTRPRPYFRKRGPTRRWPGCSGPNGPIRWAALKPQAIWLAVHRHGNTIYYKRLCTEEFGVLSGLNEGLTLEQAIEHGCKGSELDANEAPAMLQSMFTTWAMLQGFCSPE